jgi:RNA polymerase sigma factor (sigma-70 family)
MQHQLVTTPARPSRAQVEPAALALLSRHSAGLLATARRYSATPEDAEDAYQRGVEILLTKAPSTTEDELLPWLKTVVKHEAFAVRKSSGRAMPAEGSLDGEDHTAWTDQRAERYERLRVGAEAMAGLKPQEIRCLLLKAEGLSYQEICEVTGFSYTKVNRCLTEGRRAFLKRVAGIEAGAECERLAPVISKVADGEASPEEMRLVRPHLKGCLACKATLREYRATPARLAGLVPPVVAIGGSAPGLFARLLDRFAGMGDAAGAKVAAVAAAGVMLAGGGAGVEAMHHDAPAVTPSAFSQNTASKAAQAVPATAPASAAPDPSSAAIHAVSPAADPPAANAPAPNQDLKPVDPQPEFDPGTAAPSPSPAPDLSPPASAQQPASTNAPAASAPRRSAGSAPREFGP